ncbi:MAG: zinc ABC transporter substrate-binding protein [Clostridia bacterium]|nr:zinc ABC transporter substrate-binding protein [Clostridia bacterium]
MFKRILSLLIMTVIIVYSFAGCGTRSVPKNDKLTVVTTIFAPYDFTNQIVGDKIDVVMLLPPGVESHSYEPTPSDIITIENADLFLYVSEHTETWVAQIISSLKNTKVEISSIADGIGLEIHGHNHDHHAHEHSEDCETDEHIWTNLEYAVQMVDFIADEICQADPENADFYAANAEEYKSKILTLKNDFETMIAESERKEIVSGSRFAMKNFINEFGLQFTAAFDSCVDNTEPSAAVMAKIIDKINDDNIPVIFYEELTEPKIARAVSLETGAKMLLLHSCHNVSKAEIEKGETYLSLMSQNYINLKEALN